MLVGKSGGKKPGGKKSGGKKSGGKKPGPRQNKNIKYILNK